MADDRTTAYANWLVQNQDKKGTPEFETVAGAYKQLRSQGPTASAAPQPTPEAPAAPQRTAPSTGNATLDFVTRPGTPLGEARRYGERVAGDFMSGFETLGRGVSDIVDYKGPNSSVRTGNSATGVPRVALGLTGAVLSPVSAAISPVIEPVAKPVGEFVHRNIGKPIEDATGYPADITDPAVLQVATLGAAKGLGAAARAPGQITRGIIRGGEKGRQAVNESVQAFKEFGSSPTVGQAAPESGIGRVIESVLAKSPGGAHIMLDKFRSQLDKAGKYVNDLTTKTAGVNVTYNDAGQAVLSGARQFRTRYTKATQTLEGLFQKELNPSTIAPAPLYQKALTDLTNVGQGFPNTQATVQNSFVRELADNFAKDTAKTGGQMSVEALRGIRTRIGMEIDQAALKPDVDTGALKQLYSGLTRDLEGIAAQAGPKAKMAWDRAQRAEREGAQRLERIIDPLVKNRTIEQIQASVQRLDGTRAREIMKSLKPDQQRIVAASIMEDMGMAKPSAAYGSADVATGPQFSFETFLTNYKTMQQKGMADAIFGRPETASLKQGLDALLTASSRARESAKFLANPSGSARAGMAQAAMYSVITSPFTGFANIPATAAGFYLAPNAMARLFRSPAFVSWLGKSTKAGPASLPARITALSGVIHQDPESADAVRQYIDALRQQVGAPTGRQEDRSGNRTAP